MTKRSDRCEAHRYRRYIRIVRRTRENPRGHERPVWKCMDCPHLLYNADDLLGRSASCFTCFDVFKILPQHLRMAGFTRGTALTGDAGWRAKIICGGDCLENLKKHAGFGETSIQDLLKKTVTDALGESRSESEQERSLIADLVKQAREGE